MRNWRTFDHFPQDGDFLCPVCGTSADEPCVLIGKEGTTEGNIMEATPFHVGCINPENMLYHESLGIIYFSDRERREGLK